MRKSKLSPQQIAKILKSFDTGKSVGVTSFIKHFKHKGNGYIPITDTQYKNIDITFAKLSVGPVHGQNQFPFYGQHVKNQRANNLHR